MLRTASWLAAWLALLVLMARWIAVAWGYRHQIRAADAIVVMTTPRAFGTLYASLDQARRQYAGRNLVFVYQLERSGHNPMLAEAVPDATVIGLPRRNLMFRLFGRDVVLPPNDWHDPMVLAVAGWLARRLGNSGAILESAFDLWRRLPIPDAAIESMPKVRQSRTVRKGPFASYTKDARAYRIGEIDVLNELHMYGGWNALRAAVEVPPLRLPASRSAPISDALAKARGHRTAKLCGLHTRFGGTADKTHRDGSPLEFYIPAVRYLVDQGYQVLIQGDRSFHFRFLETFSGMVVDAESLGVDRNAFRLFCGTATDLFIGDWPVAPQFAASNGIPVLVVNAWPIGWGINGATVYYRGIRGTDGKRWDFDRTLRHGPLVNCNTVPWDFPELMAAHEALRGELSAIDQIPLSDEEILAAVTEFVQSNGAAPDCSAIDITSRLPVWTPFRMATGCRISPAWVQRYTRSDLRATA